MTVEKSKRNYVNVFENNLYDARESTIKEDRLAFSSFSSQIIIKITIIIIV